MDEAIGEIMGSMIVSVLVATAASVFLLVGFVFGGPILSGVILFKGWDNTRPLIKIGAIGFGLAR